MGGAGSTWRRVPTLRACEQANQAHRPANMARIHPCINAAEPHQSGLTSRACVGTPQQSQEYAGGVLRVRRSTVNGGQEELDRRCNVGLRRGTHGS